MFNLLRLGSDVVSVSPKYFEIRADDGYPIGVTVFRPRWTPKARLVVAGHPLIPQAFYGSFAEFATNRRFEVLTFDYRGIGRSKPADLKDFRMEALDWARRDLAAAIDKMYTPGIPLYVIGHAFAGRAFGLLPNHAKVAGFYVFGAGTGWEGYMPLDKRLRLRAIGSVLLPLLIRWVHYSPRKALGAGEDLPADVCHQWRRWSRLPRGFFDDASITGLNESFARVRTPIVAANAHDDACAPPRSRDSLLQFYTAAKVERRSLESHLTDVPIGHLGYFQRSAAPYWDEALRWFDGLARRASDSTGHPELAALNPLSK